MSQKADAPSTTEEVLDLSFNFFREVEYISDAEPRINRGSKDEYDVEEEKPIQREKSYSRCLLLNNNLLSEISELPKALTSILFNPFLLAWLDLSFNLIAELPPVFKSMTSLKILYLHGNQIATMETVANLKGWFGLQCKMLPYFVPDSVHTCFWKIRTLLIITAQQKVLNHSLLKLTLHGNPIEELKDYRMILIHMMSNVKELDFSFVTEAERGTARFLMRPKRRSQKKHFKVD